MRRSNKKDRTGGCQCGAVRYRLLAPPRHASVCHCRMCQKASGGPLMGFARIGKGELEWTRGRAKIFRSSSLVERGFCAQCGTPLTYNFLDGPNISVTIGSLDEPNAVRPELQYGIEGKLGWFASIGALPEMHTGNFFAPDLAARLVSHQHPDHDT